MHTANVSSCTLVPFYHGSLESIPTCARRASFSAPTSSGLPIPHGMFVATFRRTLRQKARGSGLPRCVFVFPVWFPSATSFVWTKPPLLRRFCDTTHCSVHSLCCLFRSPQLFRRPLLFVAFVALAAALQAFSGRCRRCVCRALWVVGIVCGRDRWREGCWVLGHGGEDEFVVNVAAAKVLCWTTSVVVVVTHCSTVTVTVIIHSFS